MSQEELTLAAVAQALERIEKKIEGNFPKGWDQQQRWIQQREFVIAALRALGPKPTPESQEPFWIPFEFNEPILIGFRTKNWPRNVSSKKITCYLYGAEIARQSNCLFSEGTDSEQKEIGHSIDCFDTFRVCYADIFIIGRHFKQEDLSSL